MHLAESRQIIGGRRPRSEQARQFGPANMSLLKRAAIVMREVDESATRTRFAVDKFDLYLNIGADLLN